MGKKRMPDMAFNSLMEIISLCTTDEIKESLNVLEIRGRNKYFDSNITNATDKIEKIISKIHLLASEVLNKRYLIPPPELESRIGTMEQKVSAIEVELSILKEFIKSKL